MSMSLLERIRAGKQQINSRNGGDRPLTLKSDKNVIRILPNWAGDPDGEFYHAYGLHYIKGSDGTVKATYICTANTFGTDCSICGEIAAIAAAPGCDEATGELLKEARGSNRILVNAVYLNGAHPNAKTEPVLLELAPTAFAQILAAAETFLEDGINIFDLEGGHDLTVTRTGTGRDTKYTVTPQPRPRALPKDIMTKARDLADFVHQENAQAEQRAIISLRTVANVLGPTTLLAGPAPVATVSRPAIAAPARAAVVQAAPTGLAAVAPQDLSTIEVVDASGVSESDLDEIDRLLADAGVSQAS